MSYTISKRFEFCASHQLAGLPEDHQCARLHGHNYSVELELSRPEVDEVGFVVDYGDLAPFKDLLEAKLDHRHLNDVLTFNPTAELVARWLFARAFHDLGLPVSAVRVYETPKTMAEYRS